MTPDWDVVLVGGPSGAGKSSVARPLARRYGVSVLEIDDLVTAVRAMTTPEQQPELFFWDTHPDPGSLDAAAIARQGRAVAAALEPALAAVIDDHVAGGVPVLMEGDFLRPEFVAACGPRVRGLFVVEHDPARIVANFAAREPGEGEQRLRAEASVVAAQLIVASARRAGVPVIEARPWADAVDRAEAALASYR
jgi:2-phosphoglycerate kinase